MQSKSTTLFFNFGFRKSDFQFIPMTFICIFETGKQAVLVLSCDNPHMSDDVMVEPGLVMIFAHGVE